MVCKQQLWNASPSRALVLGASLPSIIQVAEPNEGTRRGWVGVRDNRSADAELAALVKRTRLHLVWLLWIVSSTALTDASSKPILQRFWGTGGVQREGGSCAFSLPYTCLSATVFLISSMAFWFFFRISHLSAYTGGFPGGSVGKNPPTNAGDVRDWVWSLRWEDSLKKGMATHSSIRAWNTPRTEESCRLKPKGYQRVGHGWVTEHACCLPNYIHVT